MKLIKLSDGLMVVPGTTTERVVVCFERSFGPARAQKIPCPYQMLILHSS